MSVIAISNVAGNVPSVNQLLVSAVPLGYNQRDSLFYGLKVHNDGSKEVVCLGESISPGVTHDRLHLMTSSADHAPETGTNKGKIARSNPSTGVWELVEYAPVTLTGTTNYLPKITAANTLGQSQIYDNGTSIGIGTATPSSSYRIDLVGTTTNQSRIRLTYAGATENNTNVIYPQGYQSTRVYAGVTDSYRSILWNQTDKGWNEQIFAYGSSSIGVLYSGYNTSYLASKYLVAVGDNLALAATSQTWLYAGGTKLIALDNSAAYKIALYGAMTTNSVIASTVADGTAPMEITSGTLVTNLNADMLDGYHASAFLRAYTETDTLQSVTTRGAITDVTITVPSVKITTGATSGYYWKCTNIDGSGGWYPTVSDIYKGTWDASTNTPTLSQTLPTGVTNGWYYRVVVGGTVNLGNGNITFIAGDDVKFNGTNWERIPSFGYTLVTATESILGGVMIGANVTITGGVISVHAPVTLATGTTALGLSAQELSIDANLAAIAAITDTTGLLRKTAANTWVLDTTAYTTNTGTVTSVAITVPEGFGIAGSPITTDGTLALAFTHGYSLPTDASQAEWDTAYANRIDNFTTTGDSGAATLITNTLNIPVYSLSGLGGQAQLNGTGFVVANGTAISYDNTQYQPADDDLTAIAALGDTPGFLRKTAHNSWAIDASTYDNYGSWTMQSEDNLGTGISVSITSGKIIRLIPGTGLNLAYDTSVAGTLKLTLTNTLTQTPDYWSRSGVVLSPKTANDSLTVNSWGVNRRVIYGIAMGAGGIGVSGDGLAVGVEGICGSGIAGHFITTNGVAIKAEVMNGQVAPFINFAGTIGSDASKNISTALGAGAVSAPKRADSVQMGWIFEKMIKMQLNSGSYIWFAGYTAEAAIGI